MALRVLLADESSTIKRVMQLALQDFGVEVKSVPIGLDVISVAKNFRPDIIFADVLLSKRNGYEVIGDLKADSELKGIPTILMWSGFMELDEAKAQKSQTDARLEKPFDAEALRSLVKDLVPSLQENVISQFLSFPELPSIVEDKTTASEAQPMELEELEEPEEFQSVPLPKTSSSVLPPETPTPSRKETPRDDWSHQDLSKYKIDLQSAGAQEDLRMDAADLTKTSIALSSGIEDISLDQIDDPTPMRKTPMPTALNLSSSTSLDPVHAEDLIRQEARTVLENVAWKILPEIVERVVREELQKLLKDAERL